MPDEVRLGFIGCGGNARGHMRRLMQLPDARIVAVCDVVREAAERAAADTGATPYTAFEEMLAREELDAVYLSLPVFAHGEPEFAVIERGLPFFVEKPVARDLETALAIAARVREKRLLTAVGYQLRYAGTVDAARERLAGQRIGLVAGRYWCGSGMGDPGRWLRQMALSGGQIVEQATHTIDLMRYLAGEIVEVFSYHTSQVLRSIDCPDHTATAMRFENGAVGALTTSWAYPHDWQQTNVIDILFENARLEWSTRGLVVVDEAGEQRIERPGPGIDEVFVAAVRTGDPAPIRSPYDDAVRTLAVTLAINESAASGRPVRVPNVG